MRDYRIWWALFVFFAVLSLLAVQHRYRRWRTAGRALRELSGPELTTLARRWRIEAWRLVLMVVAIVAMTGVVFAAVLEGPPTLILLLRVLAVASVVGVLLLGFRR